MPIVLLCVTGYGIKRTGLVDASCFAQLNRLCFHVFLPVLLFMNIYRIPGLGSIDWRLAAFVLAAIVGLFLLSLLIAKLFVPVRNQKGVMMQAVFRSNYAIIGVPLATSLFGEAGAQTATMLTLFAVPLFNVFSVVALGVYRKEEEKRVRFGALLLDIVKNPLIIGIFCGLAVLCVRALLTRAGIGFRLTSLAFVYAALEKLALIASPLALVTLGAQFTFSAARALAGKIALGTALRIVVAPALGLAAAALCLPKLGGAGYAALLALFGSPIAVSSAVMAAEMDGDAELAGQLVVWTTVLSTLTIFGFVFLFRSIGIF